ncbi:DUF805 domain-containing protein [Kocuria rhizophila]|uniref:DUF805 domain-containing protein n=1 Tax=Kocuria TaxID=57493 RepID=UPI0002DCD645|nr:DUF805 domain-containing protein [Kocuria rhizophila]MXN61138.1 DUF805 domain-containing protein [Bacillus sp. BGMRC0062]WIW67392.1 DUF805 domain-containing protein [Kocuria sp. ChxB]KUP26928.1 hypothetical protein IX41_09725 [Kocuria rhizophila]MCR4525432.1 DUF805 domain-containing protein [Kocuria rhizophila]MCT1915764.1 DUF805 domain-containing protein [Kocuria rhizophila]
MSLPPQPVYYDTQPGEPVGPWQAVKNFVRRGTTFSGRASRSEYWWIALYTVLLSGAYVLAEDRGYLAWPDVDGGFAIALLLLSLVLLLAVVLLAIFTAALSVRRLHDCNLSGLWFLLILVPFLGSIALLIMAALPPDPRGVRFDAHPAPGTVMPAGR